MQRWLSAALAVLLLGPGLVQASSPVPTESRQMLLSVSGGWNETRTSVRRFERDGAGSPWREVGAALAGSLGRSGLAWGARPTGLDGPIKKEGDGRSPAGVFPLREATGYAKTAPPGTRLPYREATATLRCVDDPRSPHYNRLVDEAATKKDWSSAEDMRRRDDLYRLVVWVGLNDAPPRPDAGSCIFLHFRDREDSVTEGCTAFDLGVMEELLAWLDPALRPVLVQLPAPARARLAADWGLPGR